MSEMPQDRDLDARIDEAEEESDLVRELDDEIDPEAPLDESSEVDEAEDDLREWAEAHPDTD